MSTAYGRPAPGGTRAARSAPPAPTRVDPLAAAASQVIGGPAGRHAVIGSRGWRPVAAVLMAASAVLVALGVLERAPCLRSGWTTPDQFWHACYSDVPILYQTTGLASGVTPYLGHAAPGQAMEQPVLSGAVMWLVSLAVPDGSALGQQRWYFGLWALLATMALAVTVLATVRSVPGRPWRAAHVAFSPVLVTASLVSVDVLGVVLTSLGLWAWGRRRVPLAGALLGLGVATRSYPLVVLAAIGLVAVRAGRLRAYATLVVWAAVAFLLVTLPLVLAGGGGGMLAPYRAWWSAAPGYGSPWQLLGLARQIQAAYQTYLSQSGLRGGSFWTHLPLAALGPAGATALAVLGWLMALAVGALLALSTRRRPGVAEVAFVMLAIVVLTGKALPVQAALWLLPLLALVGVRWRDHLIWAGMELTYFVAVWLYIAGLSKPDRGLPAGWFAAVLVARLGVLTYLVCRVVGIARGRDALSAGESGDLDDGRPALHESDELAGPLAGAPDRLRVQFD